jgi:C1A family cysteine protease
MTNTSSTMTENQSYKMGWLPDFPDFRDYTTDHPHIAPLLAKLHVEKPATKGLATAIDLRSFCSSIEDQGVIGSCTAHAAIGMLEYFERRAFSKHIDASRLFLYKVTRNLMHETGDTGAYLRTVMGALALFGVPQEEYYPYLVAQYDQEPSAFCYALAQNYQAIDYYRLDPAGTDPATLLNRVKTNLAAGLPSMFGFSVYDSYRQAARTGKVPFPMTGDRIVGGHAILAVGYDDSMRIPVSNGSRETIGALIFRNSWSPSWGDRGYGYLPYEYILRGLAEDFWSLIKAEWIDTGKFQA